MCAAETQPVGVRSPDDVDTPDAVTRQARRGGPNADAQRLWAGCTVSAGCPVGGLVEQSELPEVSSLSGGRSRVRVEAPSHRSKQFGAGSPAEARDVVKGLVPARDLERKSGSGWSQRNCSHIEATCRQGVVLGCERPSEAARAASGADFGVIPV